MRIDFKKIISLLVIAVLLVLSGCGGSKEKITYTVVVKTEGGMPLEDVMVRVYGDKSLKDVVWIAETDSDGKTSFTAERSDKYTAVLENVMDGYIAESSYTLKGEITETLVKAEMVKSNELSDVTYGLGSVIRDFSIKSTDGTEYQISQLLKQKKAVVLNFWYLNCGPCKMEFPYLQSAYEQYSKDIEVLAINPMDGNNKSIAEFADSLGLTFPMFKGESGWEKSMKLSAYPTTVIIDRYGSIVMMHKGCITEEGVFEKIFGYFVSDDYVQGIIKNISDIL